MAQYGRTSKRLPVTATQPVDCVQAQRHWPVYGYTYTHPADNRVATQRDPDQRQAGAVQ